MISWIGRICKFMEQFLIFPKNFLDFKSDTIEKQGNKNLSSYSHRIYVSAVLSDSKVAFHGEEKDSTILSFLDCVFFIDCVA